MSVSLEKIPGVESVKVSLSEGKAAIHLKPDNRVSLEQVQDAVKKNGFSPQEATVTARGEPIVAGGTLQLNIPGPNVTYRVVGPHDRAVQDGLRALMGKAVVVEAVVPAPKDKTHEMQVKTFRPAT